MKICDILAIERMNSRIRFNKPYFTGKEIDYVLQAVEAGKISGDGGFTKKCHEFFEKQYGFPKVFLTTSCTDALEMCAILLKIQPGDEVIMPSFTFVSTPNAFVLRGAGIVFADSESRTPNVDPLHVEALITPKTRAIVVVHYAGIACEMDVILSIAQKYRLSVVEDAAQAIDSRYKEKPLGSLGDLAAFSFHESKNVISGEGGMLVVNETGLTSRAEIIWEKGTNRAAFFRGESDKYTWQDVGSSFLPSDVIAAILYAQLENLQQIQNRRKAIWNAYRDALSPLEEKGSIKLPEIPAYATNNAHMFYILCSSANDRTRLIEHMKQDNIQAIFHYLPLHKSPFYRDQYRGSDLPNCERYSECLLRLPLYYELSDLDVDRIANSIRSFFG